MHNMCRPIVFKVLDCDVDKFDIVPALCQVINSIELRFLEDYPLRDITIFDVTGISMGHIVKATPLLIKKLYTIIQVTYFASTAAP